MLLRCIRVPSNKRISFNLAKLCQKNKKTYKIIKKWENNRNLKNDIPILASSLHLVKTHL